MTSAPILVNATWFRRACAVLAAAEGVVLAWLVVRAGESGTFAAWCGVLACVVLLAIAWPPLWRSTNIRAIAWDGKAAGTRLQMWRQSSSAVESTALAWCWWWGGRLALLGFTSGRSTSWALVDAHGADAATTAQFYRGLREATAIRSEDGARW